MLSKKAMARKRYWELYEDLVISAAIRAARELFAILPFSLAKITCEATQVSQKAGMDETGAILRVEYPGTSYSP